MAKRIRLSVSQKNLIIKLAWADRISFEAIKERTGLTESEVIRVMRYELKPNSFRNWRARASGQITKHRKRARLLHETVYDEKVRRPWKRQ
ncbi:MAG: TIGR03643 family protein [Verrucomicrobiota bacterium]